MFLIKNKDKFLVIGADPTFSLKSYGFRRVVFEAIINSTGMIQLITAQKLANTYNGYYKTSETIESLFNMEYIMNHQSKHSFIECKFNDNIETFYELIDEIVSRKKSV